MKTFEKVQFYGALSISAVCFFAFLGSYALMDNNEGLYAGIPLWMTQTGNYILPRLNGVVYIEKPPMLYWLIALNFNIFGVNEWTARLVPALSGFLIGVLMFCFLRHENRKKEAVWVLLVWSASVGAIIFSRVIFFDMLFTLFFSILLISIYIYRKNNKKTWLYLAYFMAALSVLTKGLLGVALPAMTIFVYIYCEQEIKPWYSLNRFWNSIKEMFSYFSIIGMIIFIVIALPWHIAAGQQDSGFWYFYFINEHFMRFLGTRQPEDYYDGPVYYYILRLFGYLAPWIVFLPVFLWRDQSLIKGKYRSLEKFCWSWFLVVLVFFSISKAKANYYIVVGIPPLIMLFIFRMRDTRDFIYRHFLFILMNVGFCLLPLALALAWFSPEILEQFSESYQWASAAHEKLIPFAEYKNDFLLPVLIAVITSLAALGITWYARKRSNVRDYYIWTLAAVAAVTTCLVMSKFYLFENDYSSKNIITDISEQYNKKDIDLYMYIDFEEISTTPYYFGRPAVMIKWDSNDLYYGMSKDDSKKYKITLKDFLSLPTDRPIFVLMEKRRLDDFRKVSAPAGFKIWKNYGRRVVFIRKNLNPTHFQQR